MSAEAWPTEAAATAAVEAVAKKAYEDTMAARQAAYPGGVAFAGWEDLDPAQKLSVRESVLSLVWATISALPDPRYAAWAEGYEAGRSDGGYEESGHGGMDVVYPHENPYPSGL